MAGIQPFIIDVIPTVYFDPDAAGALVSAGAGFFCDKDGKKNFV